MRASVLLAAAFAVASAANDGAAKHPPLGWRSWNQFGCNVNQRLIESTYAALVDRSPSWQGNRSLADIGFRHAGLDDCWQDCTGGANGVDWHDAEGRPVIERSKFPDLKAMAGKATSSGLIPGWYMNNCVCRSKCDSDACWEGDSAAVRAYGFKSVKLDGCSAELNVSRWYHLLNGDETKEPIVMENCHNGPLVPNPSLPAGGCPFHMFRTSTDIRPSFGSVMHNLFTTIPFANRTQYPMVGPGCWPYPDMLEVGVTGSNGETLTPVESRTHFAAWAIVSSPLILGFDVRNHSVVEEVWPYVASFAVLSINQNWLEDLGTLVASSADVGDTVSLRVHKGGDRGTGGADVATSETFPATQVWAKRVNYNAVAALAINAGDDVRNVTVYWKDLGPALAPCAVGGGGCFVQSLWNGPASQHKPDGITLTLSPHDSAMLIVSQQCLSGERSEACSVDTLLRTDRLRARLA
eukprot:TRINITY_DN59045_c0_g1_i1.p1 TRINITY_DN59045_c0_g1~~TRINITY_DN59045_c0_g1_i1.p1  ORF type:complete len:466 (+),score=72.10 TRINITY_DN59045_c0_g1_i1:81-1478(+)